MTRASVCLLMNAQSDRSGTSDPFLRLSAGGQDRVQSDIISKTLNPVWGELPHGFKAVPEAKAGHRSAVLEFETYKDTLAQQNIEVCLSIASVRESGRQKDV